MTQLRRKTLPVLKISLASTMGLLLDTSMSMHLECATNSLWHSIAKGASHDAVIPIPSILRSQSREKETKDTFPRIVLRTSSRSSYGMAYHTSHEFVTPDAFGIWLGMGTFAAKRKPWRQKPRPREFSGDRSSKKSGRRKKF